MSLHRAIIERSEVSVRERSKVSTKGVDRKAKENGGGGRVTICRDARKRLAEGRPYKRVTRIALIQRTHRSCVPTKGYSSVKYGRTRSCAHTCR